MAADETSGAKTAKSDDSGRADSTRPVDTEWDPTVHFKDIITAEVKAIDRRRVAMNRADKQLKRPRLKLQGFGPKEPVLEVTGLALSGGGIRSASFAMGVLQAFNEHRVLPRIDYLSTVSGGGYMGAALSVTLTKSKGEFVFGDGTGTRGSTKTTDVKDTPALGQIRNYSNYLIPFGFRDLLTATAIVLRGLVANIALGLPFILLFAAATIFVNPYRTDLSNPDLFGIPWILGKIGSPISFDFLRGTSFGVTLLLALVGFLIFLVWALLRSRRDQPEFRTKVPRAFATYLAVVAVCFFVELQPFLIDGMFALADETRGTGSDNNSLLTAFLTRLAAIAAPIAGIVTIFRQQFAGLLKSVTAESGLTTKIAGYAMQASIWVAGAALPLLIWVGYLYLCYWGIVNNGPPPAAGKAHPEIQATVQIKGPGLDLRASVDCKPTPENPCATPQPLTSEEEAKRKEAPKTTPAGAQARPKPNKDVEHTPQWLINTSGTFFAFLQTRLGAVGQFWPFNRIDERTYKRVVLWLYLAFAVVLFGISWSLTPNANSLHRLYRDRLSKAFLFDPNPAGRGVANRDTSGLDRGRDFATLDNMRLSELVPDKDKDDADRYKDGGVPPPYAPYHLINAALNVQGSDFANRRGRNADFFLFSPYYVGSEVTGYAETRAFEKESDAPLDLPTAMAISGAAFSSNMGANSIKALTPTLALLNVRTGYWLKNPMAFKPDAEPSDRKPYVGPADRKVEKSFESRFYLWSELTGRLYEDRPQVYITDGGHIENLGIYELLRRRCKVIVVVDAEADPALRMPSFIALQRYARIDLGVRISMPWDEIRKSTTNWMGHGSKADAKDQKPSDGPHAAIGTIDYDGKNTTGYLLYIKSSLTGDENDYVRDYARRYQQFPHESTGDQFFSEEQFEVYRALGFHIGYRVLSNIDNICVFDGGEAKQVKFNAKYIEAVRVVSEALLGPHPKLPSDIEDEEAKKTKGRAKKAKEAEGHERGP